MQLGWALTTEARMSSRVLHYRWERAPINKSRHCVMSFTHYCTRDDAISVTPALGSPILNGRNEAQQLNSVRFYTEDHKHQSWMGDLFQRWRICGSSYSLLNPPIGIWPKCLFPLTNAMFEHRLGPVPSAPTLGRLEFRKVPNHLVWWIHVIITLGPEILSLGIRACGTKVGKRKIIIVFL